MLKYSIRQFKFLKYIYLLVTVSKYLVHFKQASLKHELFFEQSF
jgi:hypothetical protein